MNEDDEVRAKEHYRASRYAEALVIAERALAENESDDEAHRIRALSLQGLRRFPEAIGAIDRAISVHCEPRDLHFRARCAIAVSDFTSAVGDATKLLELGERTGDPYFEIEARLIRAVAYYYLGEVDRCREECDHLPADAVWWGRGKLHTIPMLRGLRET